MFGKFEEKFMNQTVADSLQQAGYRGNLSRINFYP